MAWLMRFMLSMLRLRLFSKDQVSAGCRWSMGKIPAIASAASELAWATTGGGAWGPSSTVVDSSLAFSSSAGVAGVSGFGVGR